MKKKVTSVLAVMVILTGLGIFVYPIVSEQWSLYCQNKAITTYEENIVQLEDEDLKTPWLAAEAYNEKITCNTFHGDAFALEEENAQDEEYWSLLNVGNNGIMGYISIPQINQKLPIYHGTSDLVLQTGVGHLKGTKLPIGGSGSHSVLVGHRGLPNADIFSGINKLEEGDRFYIHVLNQVLAYEVDQVLPMVPKDDIETLTSALQNVEGKDYVTLFTCTPYGVNSHRLLVRGIRVEYNGEDDAVKETEISAQAVKESVQNYYMFYVMAAAAGIVVSIVLIKKLYSGKRSKEEKNEKV